MTHSSHSTQTLPPESISSNDSDQKPTFGIRRVVLSGAFFLLSACAINNTSGPNLVPLPAVDSSDAMQLKIRSKFNSSPLKHHHILRVDGARVALFEESDRDTLLLTPGSHLVSLSCHTVNEIENTFPANYRVSDGNASLNIEAYSGESVCLGIGFELLNCAVLELKESSYCD